MPVTWGKHPNVLPPIGGIRYCLPQKEPPGTGLHNGGPPHQSEDRYRTFETAETGAVELCEGKDKKKNTNNEGKRRARRLSGQAGVVATTKWTGKFFFRARKEDSFGGLT